MNKLYYQWLKKSEELSNQLISACHDGDLELVKAIFLQEDKHIKPDIHFMMDSAFYFALLNQHLHVLEYLIVQKKITQTPQIQQYMANPSNKINIEMLNKVQHYFTKASEKHGPLGR